MNLCSITPVYQASWMYELPKVMLLTHLVEKNPDYVNEALKHPNNYKILDNSLIELGGALNMERLVAAAKKVKANEIILPDVFQDGDATVESAKKSIEWLKEHRLINAFKLNVACHGHNMREWEDCFNKLNLMRDINVISVPKVTATWLPHHNRSDLYPIFKNTEKEIHFLGSWYSLNELLTLGKPCWDKVRSADTCLPCLDIIQNRNIEDNRDLSYTIDLEHSYDCLNKDKYDALLKEFERRAINIYIGYGD